MTVDDIPWAIGLAMKRYRHFDVMQAAAWVHAHLDDPDLLFLRSEHAGVAIALVEKFYNHERQANAMFVMAEPGAMWDVVALLRVSHEWARTRGARTLELSSSTEYDLAPLARRLGKTREAVSHIVEID